MKWLVLFAALAACGKRHDDHAAAPAERVESFTRWSPQHEVFVEYPPFVVGQSSQLAAHVTILDGHDPVRAGSVSAILRQASGPAIEATVAAPAQPGIFLPALTPSVAGACTLVVRVVREGATDEVSSPCVVHAAGAALPAATEEPPGRITVLKETTWASDLATEPAAEHPLVPTLRTTGELRATAGREARLTATAHGRVLFEGTAPVLGSPIAAGQVLARIVPQIADAGDRVSLSAELASARTELAAAEAQLARSERLWAERTIPEKQVEEARTRVQLARVRSNAAQGRLGQFDAGAAGRTGGRTTFQVRSPLAGTLVAIHVSSGESVEDGELLFTVVDLSRVWLHADVFEPDIPRVEKATRASFRVDGQEAPIAIAPPDGNVVTIGKLVDEKTRTVPIIFELPNVEQRLRIGSFATVWIETGEPVRALAIPETALVDDAGKTVAYVQVGGEAFERRMLGLGIRSGGRVQVTSGLSPGDRVVTRAAYDIKLASAGGAVPEHGHAH